MDFGYITAIKYNKWIQLAYGKYELKVDGISMYINYFIKAMICQYDIFHENLPHLIDVDLFLRTL